VSITSIKLEGPEVDCDIQFSDFVFKQAPLEKETVRQFKNEHVYPSLTFISEA